MVVSALTAAMSVQNLSPAHAAALRTLAAAAARGGSLFVPVALAGGSLSTEATSVAPMDSLSCSPPRSSTAKHTSRHALAPTHCLAPGKARRRRRPGGQESGGDDGGDGGDSGSGGGNWYGDWDGSSDNPEDALRNGSLLWQVLCVLCTVQALQFLMDNGQRSQSSAPSAGFATLSRSFYTRRIGCC